MVCTSVIMNQATLGAVTELDTLSTHVAVGDGNTPPTISDTTLDNETHREAKFSSTPSTVSLIISTLLDITENNGNTIAEIGLFSAAAAGTMYTRNLTTPFAKTSEKSAFYDVKITLNATSVSA